MEPVVLFFGFGLVAGLLGVKVGLPKSVNRLLTFLLLMTIGIKGGLELKEVTLLSLLPQLLLVMALGAVLPVLAFPILRAWGKFTRADAAAIAAHYGSVSVGTFAVCIAFLESRGQTFEPQVSLYVVALEAPAIVVGLLLAKRGDGAGGLSGVLKEVARSEALFLLLGGMCIGGLAGHGKLEPYQPMFFGLFSGVLALFLVEMGLTVSEQLAVLKQHGLFLVGFGVLMPLVGASLALLIAAVLGLSLGGSVVLATLGASASYIAVPAAMRTSLPEANLGLSLGSSLGVTFPFNVILGIPAFYWVASSLY